LFSGESTDNFEQKNPMSSSSALTQADQKSRSQSVGEAPTPS